jgi:hypothetical protein
MTVRGSPPRSADERAERLVAALRDVHVEDEEPVAGGDADARGAGVFGEELADAAASAEARVGHSSARGLFPLMGCTRKP